MRDLPSYRLITAAAIVIAYFTVAGLLLTRILGEGIEDKGWSQVIFVFNAVGALATTAAGILLGAEVQQANVRAAQRDSQASAAEAARREQAMLQALESLETVETATGTEKQAGSGTAKARTILQRSLAPARRESV